MPDGPANVALLLQPLIGPQRADSLASCMRQLRHDTPEGARLLAYAIGAILLIATSSRRPSETLFELRLDRNLRAGRPQETAEAAAAAGLSSDLSGGGGGGLRCFHCGVEVVGDAESLEAAHATASPACSVARLEAALRGDGGAEAARLVSASSERSRRALQRLSRDLDGLSGVIGMAASFGLDRGSLVFAATRHFMLNDAQLPSRPGGFIEALHDCERHFGDSRRIVGLFDVERLLRLLAPTVESGAAAPSAASAPTPATSALATASVGPAARASAAAASEAGGADASVDDSGSDRCVLCARRCRDRVLLPCAHFCACSHCLSDRSSCPTCGSAILATVRAFIT